MQSGELARHKNNFNLLRFSLAMLVLLSHSPELIDGNRSRELLSMAFHTVSLGELAVDFFFLLSGYLIVQSWQRALNFHHFLRNRVLRIYPGFIAASLVCALIVAPLAASGSSIYFAALDPFKLVKTILLLAPPDIPNVFAGQPHPYVNGSMWTISVEFCCYLLVVAMGLAGAVRNKYAWLTVSVLTLLVFVAQRSGVTLPGVPSYGPRLATHFLIGGCFFLFRQNIPLHGFGAIIAAVLLIASMFSWRASEPAIAVAGGYLLFFLAACQNNFVAQFNRLPDISYGLYLYAWPIQKLLILHQADISPFSLFMQSAAAALIAGAASWFFVEKPALAWKYRAFVPPLITQTP